MTGVVNDVHVTEEVAAAVVTVTVDGAGLVLNVDCVSQYHGKVGVAVAGALSLVVGHTSNCTIVEEPMVVVFVACV